MLRRLSPFFLFFLLLSSCTSLRQVEPSPSLSADANGNTLADPAAHRIEMPHIADSLYFAPHYVQYEGQQIMNLAVTWDATLRNPLWVAFYWDRTTSQEQVTRGGAWKWDPQIPTTQGRVSEKHHQSDGYDKGHICASHDRAYCKEANEQTFYYSNISPQIPLFNEGYWKALEARVKAWGCETQRGGYDTVYVCKGCDLRNLLISFSGQKAGTDHHCPTTDARGFSVGGIAVPTHYFMAILALKEGHYDAIAFYVPHTEELPMQPTAAELQQYALSVSQLQQKTGIDFFCNLPDIIEQQVEERLDLLRWKW